MTSPRVVLVVGGSSGIGRATAHLLAEAGDHLALASRSAGPLEEAAAECRARGAASVSTHVVDVRDARAVERVVDDVVTEHGRLDAVVSTAAVVAYGRFEEIPADVFDAVVGTNVLGTANVARAALPVMRRFGKGTVVLLGSVLGQTAVPSMTPYVVTKWAVRSLGRQLELENRDVGGVRVCVVSPGAVDTPIYRQAANFLGKAGRPPIPVDPPERVARAVVSAVERPRPHVGVGRINWLMRLGFTAMPMVYDAAVGPLVKLIGHTRIPVPPTTGNVLEPQPDQEAVSGWKPEPVAAGRS